MGAMRRSLLLSLAGPSYLHLPYVRQLSSLREYRGRRYVASLDAALQEYRSQTSEARERGEGGGERRTEAKPSLAAP